MILSEYKCKPFLKWVGGKGQLLPELIKKIPRNFKKYYEPFVGGGALFFHLLPEDAYLSDINVELINAYEVVKEHVEALIQSLSMHVYDETYYYQIRNVDRTPEFQSWSEVERASRLIFLNKTCYNGLYRVNSKGEFNTPFGKYTNPTIVDEENLRACSKALQRVTIRRAPFEAIEKKITHEDFVYFDPPYVPISNSASFTSYDRKGFDLATQEDLFKLCQSLDAHDVKFMLSNSAVPFVLDLYKQFNIETVKAIRAINSKGAKRGEIDEVIITNY